VSVNRLGSFKTGWLAIGDAVVYLVATLLGFASHDELALAVWGRFLATFVSFVVAWFLISPWIVRRVAVKNHGLARAWQPALAAIYAAPLGAWLRGLWIGAPIQVVFVAVMAIVTAALMAVWRAGVLSLINRTG
jgi:hypothetical protein